VVALPDERNFRSIDIESSTYLKRLKPIPQITQILIDFGWKLSERKEDVYMVVDNPDIRKMESGVNELILEIKKLSRQTPIYKSVRFLLKNNPTDSANFVIEKLIGCINNIVTSPLEVKYHKFRLDKLFKKTGLVNGANELIRLLGFNIDVAKETAAINEGFDSELLKLRMGDLQRSWKEAAVAIAKAKQIKAKTANLMEE